MSYVWMLEDCNCNYEAYECLGDAYNDVLDQIQSWIDVDEEDKQDMIAELQKNYTENGFWVEDSFWCYSVNFNPKRG